ncbi:hypothetical protein ACQR3P_09885, partial [Rhodococcus sp. IEGM1300]
AHSASLLADTLSSRAGSLPHLIGVEHLIGVHHKTCGSKLAREGAGTFNIIIGRHIVIASRLAPTFDRCRALDWRSPQNLWVCVEHVVGVHYKTCGSEPARDGSIYSNQVGVHQIAGKKKPRQLMDAWDSKCINRGGERGADITEYFDM